MMKTQNHLHQKSSSNISDPNKTGSSITPHVSNEANQDIVEDVVTPTQYITPATALFSIKFNKS